MNDRTYRILWVVALVLTVGWVGWSILDSFILGRAPGDTAYLDGETLFSDEHYERALAKYDEALAAAPGHAAARRGRARSLLQLGRLKDSLAAYDALVATEPELGANHANRGILLDRMGLHEEALAAYRKALELEPELAEGPNWLTRFFRLQPEKPPTIAERARYLAEQLSKPPEERRLRWPEKDAEQRSYKQ